LQQSFDRRSKMPSNYREVEKMSMPYLGYSEDILVGKASMALKVERQKN